jgi:hypothetical protein
VNATAKRLLAGGMKNVLILVALVLAFFVLTGGISLLRGRTCDRLDDERVALLEPGHDTPGPGYTYVLGMGTEASRYTDYRAAESALMNAGCEFPTPP